MKKSIAVLLCIFLIFSLSVTGFASETDSVSQTDTESITETGTSDSAETEGSGQEETVHTHTWDAGTVTSAATCTTDGVKTYSCACGATATETIAATGHAYGQWTSGESGHQRVCSSCGETESAAHSMTSQVTSSATCITAGVETYSCSVCSYSYTKEVPITTTHAFGDWSRSESSHSRTCPHCAKTESGSHSWAAEMVTVPATCKEEGATAQICTVCDGILVGILPKLTTHTYDNACDGECNICGITRETQHEFSAAWSKNSSYHWHECKICKEKGSVSDHFPGPAATEEKAQLCLTCGLVMTPKLNHQHKYSTQWTSDETGHWYACTGCEEQKAFAEHEYDDPCDPDCNVCRFHSPTAHSYAGTWSSDETGHWTVCTECGEAKETEAHIVDPNTAITDAQYCTVCGFEVAPAQVHIHEDPGQWESNSTSHWKSCICGELLATSDHTWDAGIENDDSTVVYRCTECSLERTVGEPKEPNEFPFALIMIVLILAIIGVATALIFVLISEKKKKGRYRR